MNTFLEKIKAFFFGPENDPHIVHLDHREGKGKGFRYKGNEFVHHTTLHPFETAFYNLVRHQKLTLAGIGAFFVLLLTLNWHLTLVVLFSTLTVVYFIDLLFNAFVIFRTFSRHPEISIPKAEVEALTDAELPVYTIFCPLYKEWQVAPQFAEAMGNLDYPKEKLQIVFLLEENDKETIEKIKALDLPSHFEIIVVPHSKPKTKPKAMNYGLAHVRGKYLVIYDAEDVPDVDQLKKAIVAFKHAKENIVCVQAKLNFYNPRQNVLTRIFTAEYSLWFDLVLPGLQSISAPIPLGGTSNHFKVDVLRELGGWDAFNVTEDCDLGMRLAKRGYRTSIIDSTTAEEANSDLLNWYNQRSRWIKGYIQTYFVHMRKPKEFIDQGKIKDLAVFQLMVGGKIISLFINPIMWVITACYFVFRASAGPFIESLFPGPILTIGVFSLIFGNFLYLYYYMIGCAKRGHVSLIKYVFLVPFYWLLMSIAAWKAMYEIIVKPHYWSKTVHGLHLAPAKIKMHDVKPLTAEQVKTPVKEQVPEKMPEPSEEKIEKKPSGIFGKLTSGAGFLVMSSVIANVINFGFNAFLGRTLSLSDFGIVTMINTFAFLVSLFTNAISTTATHTISYLEGVHAGRGKKFFVVLRRTVFFTSLLAGIVWAFFTPAIAAYFNVSALTVIIAFAPAIIFDALDSLNRGYLQGTFSFGMLAVVTLAEVLSKFGAAVAFVYSGNSALAAFAIPFSLVATWSVSASFTRFAGKGNKHIPASPVSEPKSLVTFYAASLMSGLSMAAFLSLDVILAKHYLSENAAGVYSLLSLVGKMIFFFGTLLNVFIVTLVSRAEGQKKNPGKDFYKIFIGTTTLTAFASLGLIFFDKLTLPILLGSQAVLVYPYITFYSFAIALLVLTYTLVTYHLARQHYLFSFISLGMSAVMWYAIAQAHGSIFAIVNALVGVNLLYFGVVMFVHIFYFKITFLYRNIRDVVSVFRPLPKATVPARGAKRILIFNWRDTESSFAGGAETYIMSLASRWVKGGHSVTLFTSNDTRQKQDGWIDGVRIVRRGGFFAVYICAAIYYIFKFRGEFDVIIDCENGIPFFTPLYAKEPVYCLVHHIHQDVFRSTLPWPFAAFASFLEKDFMPYVYKRCTFVTVSESSKHDMEALHVTDKEVDVVHPGVDLDFLTPGEKSETPLVAYVGRLKDYKSVDVLIRAFKEIVSEMPQAQLAIVGGGDPHTIKNLQRITRDYGLTESVTFAGKVSEEVKLETMQKAWVIVNPSMMEGWGITTIEANACGTPVVASNVPGLRDSVKDGETGTLVPYADTMKFANAILKLLKDESLRAEMSSHALTWAKEFDWQKSADQFISIISTPDEPRERVISLLSALSKAAVAAFVIIRRMAYLTLGALSTLSFRKEKGVVVLCYHSVAEDNWRFSVNFQKLKDQINYLMLRRKPISAEELELHVSGEKIITEPAFIIAFDDGYRDLLVTKQYFKELGIKPVVFVLADSENANRYELDTERPLLSHQEIAELKADGWTVGCHSLTHADLAALSGKELGMEIVHSKAKLEEELGFPISYFAYPKGKYSPLILEAVKEAGYAMAFSMDEGLVSAGADPVTLPRIGVDRTHTLAEFKVLGKPILISARQKVRRGIEAVQTLKRKSRNAY